MGIGSVRGCGMTVTRALVLFILAVDGVISAIVGSAFLTSRIGTVPFPIGLAISAILNMILVWCALSWAPSTRWAGIPVWAFIATTMALTFGGPGGDIVYTGLWPLVLLVVGALPAVFVLRRAGGH